jgi:hypothetical protein
MQPIGTAFVVESITTSKFLDGFCGLVIIIND